MEPMQLRKVAELKDRELAWAVAEVLGMTPNLVRGDFDRLVVIAHFERSPSGGLGRFGPFDPTTDWNQAGPLLFKAGIAVGPTGADKWPFGHKAKAWSQDAAPHYGDDYLEAGMRHLVFITAGPAVNVPELLVRECAHDREHPLHPSGMPMPKAA
jgi:hypothetical protein